FVEADVAADGDPSDVAVHHRERADADVRGARFGNQRRGAPWSPALPFPDGAGVAGAGRRPLALDAGDEQGILVDPSGVVLALGHDEAAGDELAGGKVELADDVGIAAAGAEADQAAAIFGRQAIGPVPHPRLALG